MEHCKYPSLEFLIIEQVNGLLENITHSVVSLLRRLRRSVGLRAKQGQRSSLNIRACGKVSLEAGGAGVGLESHGEI